MTFPLILSVMNSETTPSVLIVTTVPITLEAFLLPIADHLRDNGWRVDAVSRQLSERAVITKHFDASFDMNWSRRPFSPRNLFGATGRIRRLVQDGQYDIVHIHTPVAAWITRFALRNLRGDGGPKIVYTAHGFHFHSHGNPVANLVYRTMERLAARWTDLLITINDEDFAAATSFGTIDPSRVRLIHGIGVDTEHFIPDQPSDARRRKIRSELGVSEETVLVTMVAEMAPVKRHHMAIEAIRRTSDDRILLLLVGEGPLAPKLRALVNRHDLTDRIRFAGYRQDIDQILVGSDALLLCSEREGFARCVLEAMSCGIPIVGTDTRGISDAVGAESGWITGHDDIDGLAHALDMMAANPEERKARGAAGRARAESEFSLSRVIAAYDRSYAEVLSFRG